jgi:hypothetical protein
VPSKTKRARLVVPYEAELLLLGSSDAAVYAAERGDLAMFREVAARAKTEGVLDLFRCIEVIPSESLEVLDHVLDEFASW